MFFNMVAMVESDSFSSILDPVWYLNMAMWSCLLRMG